MGQTDQVDPDVGAGAVDIPILKCPIRWGAAMLIDCRIQKVLPQRRGGGCNGPAGLFDRIAARGDALVRRVTRADSGDIQLRERQRQFLLHDPDQRGRNALTDIHLSRVDQQFIALRR